MTGSAPTRWTFHQLEDEIEDGGEVRRGGKPVSTSYKTPADDGKRSHALDVLFHLALATPGGGSGRGATEIAL